MINDLPAELLLNILSHLDNLAPLSYSSRDFNASVRDYRASLLRGRIARIPHARLLINIWSPPTFFQPRRHNSLVYHPVSTEAELMNLLGDASLIPRLDAYITSLERRISIVSHIADHLERLLSFSSISHSVSQQRLFATRIVIYLWSAQQRYAHDPDGYISSLPAEGLAFERLARREDSFAMLDSNTRRWIIEAYRVLSMRLRPPFVPPVQDGEGLWLWRLIVRDGMEGVLWLLESRR